MQEVPYTVENVRNLAALYYNALEINRLPEYQTWFKARDVQGEQIAKVTFALQKGLVPIVFVDGQFFLEESGLVAKMHLAKKAISDLADQNIIKSARTNGFPTYLIPGATSLDIYETDKGLAIGNLSCTIYKGSFNLLKRFYGDGFEETFTNAQYCKVATLLKNSRPGILN